MIFRPPQITERIPDVTSWELGKSNATKNNVFKAVVGLLTTHLKSP